MTKHVMPLPSAEEAPAPKPTAAEKRALALFLGGFAALIALILGLAVWIK